MWRFLFVLCLLGAAASAEVKEDPRQLALDGAVAFEGGDLEAGRAKFTRLLELEPENIVALVNLGSLEYRAGRLEEAEAHLRRATRLSPESFSAWLTLGVTAHDAGKLDLALAALFQAVLLDPKDARTHSYLGVTLGRKGWLDGAEAEFRKAVELDDTHREAHFNLAVLYLQHQPPARELARRHYRRARELGAEPDSLIEKQLAPGKEK